MRCSMTKQERKRFKELYAIKKKGVILSSVEEEEFEDLVLEYQKASLKLSTAALIFSAIAQVVVLIIAIISKITN